uniref:Copia protein, related n=1 Tax=Asparagus officinalis TaxID=4686 RepID=Q2AA78_ASPOF|nr:Copia protein, related [Asparagus officinalis]
MDSPIWIPNPNPKSLRLAANVVHTRVAGFSDADWAKCPFDRRSTTGYYVFLGGNLVSWKSKKQSVVSRSSAESEYRTMTNVILEMVWIRDLLTEISLPPKCPMDIYGDNKAAIHIAENPVFHERTKQIEVDCHVVRNKLEDKIITTKHVSTIDQLADIITKPLGMHDIYAPA